MTQQNQANSLNPSSILTMLKFAASCSGFTLTKIKIYFIPCKYYGKKSVDSPATIWLIASLREICRIAHKYTI